MWALHAQTKKRRLQLRASMMQPFMCQDPLLAHSGQGRLMTLPWKTDMCTCIRCVHSWKTTTAVILSGGWPTALTLHHLVRTLPWASPCWWNQSPATAAAWWAGQGAQQPPGCHCNPLVVVLTLAQQRGLPLTLCMTWHEGLACLLQGPPSLTPLAERPGWSDQVGTQLSFTA